MNISDIYDVISNIVTKYITGYLSIAGNQINFRVDSTSDNDKYILLTKTSDIISEIENKSIKEEIISLDSSSRSITSTKGLVSFGAIAIVSSSRGIFGVHPPIGILKSLNIEVPFIAIAPSAEVKNSLDPFMYSNKYIMTTSLDGTPFNNLMDAERVEAELRFVLETYSLSKTKGFLTLLDGPLYPYMNFLSSKYREKVYSIRSEFLHNRVIGIVKRLEKSTILRKAIPQDVRFEFYTRYKVDPWSFLSDESFLFHLVRFNFSPPYNRLYFGPICRIMENDKRVYIHYLIIPYHPYVAKFSMLRVETLEYDESLITKLGNLEITRDGIPKILAFSDKIAKEISAGILKLISGILESAGIFASFSSRLEMVNV